MRDAPPTRTTAALLTAMLGAGLWLVPGCGSSWLSRGGDASVQPEDFIGQPGEADDTPADDTAPPALVATDRPDADTAAAGSDRRATAPSDALAVDAMVGHINGEAVYADQVFDVNLQAQLASFGRRFDDQEFLAQAAPVIEERLRGIIINKLILGEAERNLGETQRRAIEQRVEAEREELMRYYGRGSIAMAKAKFLEDRGIELDDHLAAFREELSIRFFLQSRVMPRIVVNQRDVERWYEDHKDQFVQPDRRVIRMMRVTGADHAETLGAIDRRLGRGESFEQVASDPAVNSYNAAGSGLFNGGEPLAGEVIIGIKPVNDALLQLAEGEHAGPIAVGDTHYFVQVVGFEPGVTVSLADAQVLIEERLRAEQFERQALRVRMDLFERGSYSDPMQMGEKLLEIAYARYDQ